MGNREHCSLGPFTTKSRPGSSQQQPSPPGGLTVTCSTIAEPHTNDTSIGWSKRNVVLAGLRHRAWKTSGQESLEVVTLWLPGMFPCVETAMLLGGGDMGCYICTEAFKQLI